MKNKKQNQKEKERSNALDDLLAQHPEEIERIEKTNRFPLQAPITILRTPTNWNILTLRPTGDSGSASFVCK